MSLSTYAEPDQQVRRSRRRFWIMVGSITAIALIALAIYVGFTAVSIFNSLKDNGPISVRYYLDIQSGDYTTAYTYLDSHGTIDGQVVDQQSFTRLAKAADAQYGSVHGINLNNESDATSNATHVTVTVDRGSRSYDVHLVLQQENGTWKIVSADGI